MMSRSAWSGIDFPPLPHESSLSVLWRFAWWNALTFLRLKELCKGTGNQFNNSLLFDPWMDTDHFASQTQWRIPSDIEQKIFRSIDKKPYSDVWFDSVLRICPICLEVGYHSVWHQFKPLQHCPMHHCMLQTRCQSCGTTLEDYNFSPKLLATPYECRTCGGPISGVALDFRLHCEFRTHHKELVRIYQPFADWLEKAESALSPLRELHEQQPHWPLVGCSGNNILRCWHYIDYQLHPPPVSCVVPPLPKLNWSRWEVTFSELRDVGESRPSAADTAPEATAIYRRIACQLHEWLLRTISPGHLDAALRTEPHWGWGNRFDLWSRDPREIAYVLLRAKNETGSHFDLNTWPGDAHLWKGPALDLPRYKGCVPNKVLHRMYMAIYAGLVARVYHVRRKKRLATPDELEPEDVSLAAQVWKEEPYGFSGWIVSPAVEGLPLTAWPRSADLSR